MKKVFILMLLLLTILITGYSDDNVDILPELKKASQIEDPFQRLKQYDSIMSSYQGETEVLTVEKVEVDVESKWEIKLDINPMDDSKKITFILVSEEGAPTSWQSPVALIIRYNNNKTELYINWGELILGDFTVTMRIGKDKAETKEWTLSTNSEATFYQEDVNGLIKRILEVDKTVFQVTSSYDNPIVVTFDVRSLKEEAAPYIDDLKWW
jgi:type VI secretion system protein VasI